MPKFFTVDRTNAIFPNQTFELITNFEQIKIYNVLGLYTKEDASQRVLDLFPDGISRHGVQYLLTTGLSVFQPGTRIPVPFTPVQPIMEAMFEQVRRNEFPDIPSRMQSMFAWQHLKDAQEFSINHGNHPIYEVETDDFFIADQTLILLGASTIGTFELAKRYWAGISSNHPKFEVVIPLPQTIGEKVVFTK